MTVLALEIILIFLLLVANGVFAMSEIAIVTARRARLEQLAETGNERAHAALALAREPTQFLSTVQVGITLVGILAGAFGGARLAKRLALQLDQVAALSPYSDAIAFTLVVGTITYFSVIIGELVPKRIALHNPEQIAMAIAGPMRVFAIIGAPVVFLLTKSTDALFRLIPISESKRQAVTEEDIRALLVQGTISGAVHKREQSIAERVLRMGDRSVSAIMTPRPDIDWIDVNGAPETLRERLKVAIRSRFLVCEGSIDNVLGVVRADDVLAATLDGEPIDMRAHLRQPLFVPSTMPVLGLLEAFQSADVHAAVVLDEFGSVAGIATLNDILQDLVEETPGSTPEASPDLVRRDDGSWLADGTMPVDEVEAAIGIDFRAVEQAGEYRTLGGLVMVQLGHVPRVGESFDLAGYRFEVVDMDGRRIDRVLIVKSGDKGAISESRPDQV